MITVFVMATCPDCTAVKQALGSDARYELIDIGTHVRHLKTFLRLRDSHPAFAAVRARGAVGIPCFALPDGSVSFEAERFLDAGPEVSVAPEPLTEGAACSLDGTGC